MNKLRVPLAHGTGPSFHNEVNMYSRVTRSADPSDQDTLQPDSRSSSMWSISNATRVWRSREDSTPYGDVRKTMVFA